MFPLHEPGRLRHKEGQDVEWRRHGSMHGLGGSGCGKFVYDDGLCRACFATQRESAASKCSKGCGKWVRLYYEKILYFRKGNTGIFLIANNYAGF